MLSLGKSQLFRCMIIDVKVIFKDWLVALLKDKNLTYEQLGDLIGVSHGAVGGWVRGRYTPDPAAFSRLDALCYTCGSVGRRI